jgi:lysophospholipase L1-like esterase
LLLGFGDSYTAGGGEQSYPYVAADLLDYDAHNYAVGGAITTMIPAQLMEAAKMLGSATHVVFTIGGNDLAGIQTLLNIAQVNITEYEQKCTNFQPTLVATYKLIQSVVRPGTKIYAVPYVDIISVGNKIPYEAECHRVFQAINNVVRNAATEANIGFIDSVISAFLGHEMYSADPYADGFDHPQNLYHPNLKGYAKIGQVVAVYIKSH